MPARIIALMVSGANREAGPMVAITLVLRRMRLRLTRTSWEGGASKDPESAPQAPEQTAPGSLKLPSSTWMVAWSMP